MDYIQCHDGKKHDCPTVNLTSALKIRVTDPNRIPLPKARCSVVGDEETLIADDQGVVRIPLDKVPPDVLAAGVILEWKPDPSYAPGVNESEANPGPYRVSGQNPNHLPFITETYTNGPPMRAGYIARLKSKSDEDCSSRLANLNFGGPNLALQVKAYQSYFQLPVTGSIDDIREELVTWHDGGACPPLLRHVKPLLDPWAKRLHDAFNYGFFNTTDEDTIASVLGEASTRGAMDSLIAYYDNMYGPQRELSLEDELYDELGGKDLKKALRLYYKAIDAIEPPEGINTAILDDVPSTAESKPSAAACDMSGEAKRLYDAFNVGFLGGTDEKTVKDVLRQAYANNQMYDLDKCYNGMYVPKDELCLEDELYDELGGDDLRIALSHYYRGMAQHAGHSQLAKVECDGTLAPSVELPETSVLFDDWSRKYQLGRYLLDLALWMRMRSPQLPTKPDAQPSGSQSSGSGADGLGLPNFDDILTHEITMGRTVVKIKIPEEAGIKIPIHFMDTRMLIIEFKGTPSESGTFTLSARLIGNPDFNVIANLGVSSIPDKPVGTAGISVESTRTVRYDPLKSELEKKMPELIKKLEGAVDTYRGESKETNPLARYKEKAGQAADVISAVADIYDALDKAKPKPEGDSGAEKAPMWSVGVTGKLSLSGEPLDSLTADNERFPTAKGLLNLSFTLHF